MSPIAEILIARGDRVSGSDQKRSAATDRLQALGAAIFEGHAAANVHGAHVVVTTSAVSLENPEVTEARRLSLPVVPRAEMLAELMLDKTSVAVSGSHGKTTTTAMVASVLETGGLDPTLVLGGRLQGQGSGARLGQSAFMVVEADESDRSFLKLTPTLAVVTNIDREHLDTYRDLDDVQAAFLAFANRVPAGGATILCADDAPTRALIEALGGKSVSYGLSEKARVQARDVSVLATSASYTAVAAGQTLGRIALSVAGAHNVLNSLAAVAVGLELDIAPDAIRAGLSSFRSVDRRFQRIGQAGDVVVIDDYGHHPTEIHATLSMLRTFAGERRTVVLFQPHRFTRTLALWNEFASAFAGADVLLLADIYAASEAPIDGVDSRRLADAIATASGQSVLFAGGLAEAAARLALVVRPGDVVLTLGAGPVHEAGEALLEHLEGRV